MKCISVHQELFSTHFIVFVKAAWKYPEKRWLKTPPEVGLLQGKWLIKESFQFVSPYGVILALT
jgi:hypothetical protein